MMTREEAIKLLKQYQGYDPMFPDGETLKHAFDLTDETVDTLLTALRPVSRERVEKVFPGCPYCKPDSEGYVQKFGAYSILNGELKTGHCKPQKISFCPHCSRPLTDEAVEMVMKRMEVLNDAD
jgi:hypothetical protein